MTQQGQSSEVSSTSQQHVVPDDEEVGEDVFEDQADGSEGETDDEGAVSQSSILHASSSGWFSAA
jgi:hypothetical protein